MGRRTSSGSEAGPSCCTIAVLTVAGAEGAAHGDEVVIAGSLRAIAGLDCVLAQGMIDLQVRAASAANSRALLTSAGPEPP
jgi:hypothetical protein